jgi:hypothetical protein
MDLNRSSNKMQHSATTAKALTRESIRHTVPRE